MHEIQKYYNLVKEHSQSLTMLPFHDKEAQTVVSFVLPVLNAEGFYRDILPALYLNKYSDTHKAYILNMRGFAENIHINDYDAEIKADAVMESDWMVFPFITTPLAMHFDKLRRENPKIQIAYEVDYNFFEIPDLYPHRQMFNRTTRDAIIQNMRSADQIIIGNTELEDYFLGKLREDMAGSGTKMVVMPTLVDKFYLAGMEDNAPPEDKEKFRILISANQSHFQDLNAFRDIFTELNNKYADDFELVLFGFDGKLKDEMKDCMRNIKFIHTNPVNIFDYFQKLWDLHIDLAMIPIKDTHFNVTSKNTTKFIEFSSLGIPCIVSAIGAYDKLCRHNDNALTCKQKKEWIHEFDLIKTLEGKQKLKEITNRATAEIWNYYDVRKAGNIKILEEIFD